MNFLLCKIYHIYSDGPLLVLKYESTQLNGVWLILKSYNLDFLTESLSILMYTMIFALWFAETPRKKETHKHKDTLNQVREGTFFQKRNIIWAKWNERSKLTQNMHGQICPPILMNFLTFIVFLEDSGLKEITIKITHNIYNLPHFYKYPYD